MWQPYVLNRINALRGGFTKTLKGSKTFDFASVAAGAQSAVTTVTVAGAKLGDTALASVDKDLQGCQLVAYVSAANTVSVFLRNGTAGAVDLASATLKATVLQ